MYRLKSAPPPGPLVALVERLERAGIVVALGGSGLLAALGLTDTVGDWDLTTDAGLDPGLAALAGERGAHTGSDELHADQKLMLAGGSIEVILGFAFHTARGVVRIPTRVTGRWHGVPLGSPEAWAVAYHLLGRHEMSEALWRSLGTGGPDRAAVERMLREPLPPALASRLENLPTSSDT
ncbi:MAG: hypothetical protein AAB113_03335 [Candidatus Eisenbacteria bacterium]